MESNNSKSSDEIWMTMSKASLAGCYFPPSSNIISHSSAHFYISSSLYTYELCFVHKTASGWRVGKSSRHAGRQPRMLWSCSKVCQDCTEVSQELAPPHKANSDSSATWWMPWVTNACHSPKAWKKQSSLIRRYMSLINTKTTAMEDGHFYSFTISRAIKGGRKTPLQIA